MGVFKDTDHVYECIGGLFDKMSVDEAIGPKLRKAGIVLRFRYNDPEAIITVDCTQDGTDGAHINWHRGEADLDALVEMSMTSDTAHKFWLGKVNLLTALTKREIKAKGPIPKVLKLLPIIKPGYKMYKEHLQAIGQGEMTE